MGCIVWGVWVGRGKRRGLSGVYGVRSAFWELDSLSLLVFGMLEKGQNEYTEFEYSHSGEV